MDSQHITKPHMTGDINNLKIVFGYSYPPSAYANFETSTQQYLARLRDAGLQVEAFCLSVSPPSHPFVFKELDLRWRLGDKPLLEMYERLEKTLEGKDVFINGPGINLHPRFVEKLPVFTVFQCFDDPESSDSLSRPVAAAYDLCLVGNIAEVKTYRNWGVKEAHWTALGIPPELYDTTLTYEHILEGKRDIDLFMMIDRLAPWRDRKVRLDKLASAFPDAHFYGQGWSRGYVAESAQRQYLQRAKIGPNLHNSTGPINTRTFYLPANGVMQICDNKSHLGHIFELGKQVVGFDTVDECVDLCRYYLAHDEERRKIAAEGWKRAVRDYNQVSIFKRNMALVQSRLDQQHKRLSSHMTTAAHRKSITLTDKMIYGAKLEQQRLTRMTRIPAKIWRQIIQLQARISQKR